MSMLTSISGFPEWLPADRLVEQAITELVRSKLELYGFTPIETRLIEPVPMLLAKGETDKEIYTLRRLQAGEDDSGPGLGLHFDLTLPFARYVLENRGKLVFPFRRYQIQKAWRGERPGLGRYREFLQADFDIIDEGSLPAYSDLEVVQTVNEIVAALPIPAVRIQLNNRKILEGFYQALGIEAVGEVLRLVDKLEKVGAENVRRQLVDQVGLRAGAAEKCVRLGQIQGQDPAEIRREVASFRLRSPLLDEGLEELNAILEACRRQPGNSVVADLSIARGLDYYTGTVLEGRFVQFPRYPSILGGGRYDRLASTGALQYPGVGVTIGLTRILGIVLHEGALRASRNTPSCVLVALASDEQREASTAIAQALRGRGIPCEVYPRAVKYGRQIAYAEKLGIPYVWFPDEAGRGPGEVRDLRTRSQVPADPCAWTPPEADRLVRVIQDDAALQALLARWKT